MVTQDIKTLIQTVDLMDNTDRLMLADILEDVPGREREAYRLRVGPVLVDGKGTIWRRGNEDALLSFEDYADRIDYRNQREVYGDSLEGYWFYCDDTNCVIYWGTFGNDHYPGSNANHEVYDTREEYEEARDDWECRPEFEEEELEDDPHAIDTFDIEQDGKTFRVNVLYDDDNTPPWERADGHGPVRRLGRDEKKLPGERFLIDERFNKVVYDWQEAMRIALKDGWGHGEDVPGETKRQKAARAVGADYQFLRSWCRDEWHYVGVRVFTGSEETSLWGIEGNETEYIREAARNLARELVD